VPALVHDALVLGPEGAEVLVSAQQGRLSSRPLPENQLRPTPSLSDTIQGSPQVPHPGSAEEVSCGPQRCGAGDRTPSLIFPRPQESAVHLHTPGRVLALGVCFDQNSD
jgi:hypothetical protein